MTALRRSIGAALKDRPAGFFEAALALLLVSGAVYLFLVWRFGYYNDDWYLIYAARVGGPGVFQQVYSVDRPMRALVMAAAYALFGPSALPYNLSALLSRALSAVFVFAWLRMLWPQMRTSAWLAGLLFVLYPGFLSQGNGIDYQSQMVSLAAAMLSVVVLLRLLLSSSPVERAILFPLHIILTTFYLGLVEYFIGFEVVKLGCVVVLARRHAPCGRGGTLRLLGWSVLSLAALLPFVLWRFLFFQSERGATDIGLQLGDVLVDPLARLAEWSVALARDLFDVLVAAIYSPLRLLIARTMPAEWLASAVLAAAIALLCYLLLARMDRSNSDAGRAERTWKLEAAGLGVAGLVFGLLPVIVVGRYVDFDDFSRYALAPSLGGVLLWVVAVSSTPGRVAPRVLALLLIFISTATHYLNAFVRSREADLVRQFWWQVSWRIPQLERGTTLVAHYPVETEEDYFVWGPANLIYYPDGTDDRYIQPGIYAAVLSEDTVARVLSRQPQEFSNRRGIRTYRNYRNVLVLTRPGRDACVHVLDGRRVELSSNEDARIVALAGFSEVSHIEMDGEFMSPPQIPFGEEPSRGWCYLYEQAAYSRQAGEWQRILALGDEALERGLVAGDAVEWLPFLEAYARLGDAAGLQQVADRLRGDSGAVAQACSLLTSLGPPADEAVEAGGRALCTAAQPPP